MNREQDLARTGIMYDWVSLRMRSTADRAQMYASRHTYLPLLIPEIRENLVEIALDDQQLAETNEAEWWFEEDAGDGLGFAPQGPCKW